MENCSLLKIQKGCPLQITWNGSEECFKKHEKKIYSALSNGEISWKRQDQKSPYPLQICFKPKFVPFKEELVITPTEEPASISSIAFFHVYFIYVESADEYRLKVRPEISEWFATLNAIENSQWFIIFDSGRAKEKKNRGHVMEKIKSDFARFLDRLIEMNEQNEKISLEFVQLTLSTALDNFIASHENYFLKLKTSFMSDGTWNLGRLINQQVHICRIYWSLSLFENVLALLDELGLIITDILNKVSEKSSVIFRYVLQCINRISDDVHILNISTCDVYHEIWTVILSIDAFDLCDMLCTLETIDSGVIYFGQLLYHRCLSLSSIFNKISSNGFNKDGIIKWLDFILNDSSSENLLTPNVIKFTKTLADEDPEKFREYYKDALLDGFRLFEKFHWTRLGDFIRNLLIEFFRHSREEERIYEYLSHLIEDLLKDFHNSKFLLECCHLLLSNFTSYIETDPELFFDCLLILVVNDAENSEEIFNELIPKIKNSETKIQRYNFAPSKTVFPFRIKKVSPCFLEAVINTSIRFEASIDYALPFALSNCKIKFAFKKLSKSTLDAGLNPIFSSSLGTSDSTFRFACVSKGLLAKELDLMEYLQSSIHKCEDFLIFSPDSDDILLQSGHNSFTLRGETSRMGCYLLNHIEIAVGDSLVFLLHYQQEMDSQSGLENIFCSVGVRMPSVSLISADKNLFSGVAQRISFNVSAGTIPINEETKLHVSVFGKNKIMEFLNEENKWEKEAEIFIKPLASEESYTVDVFLCLAIDRMNYSANQALKVQHKVEVKWRDQSWTFSLNFSPIMSLKTMTSVLEDRVLFEVDIQRCDGQSNMFIQPINAEILQHNSVVKPPMEAKLLNPLLEPILENSSVRIIWQIPVTKIDKTVPIKHHLKLLYQVEWDENKPKNENGAIPQCAFDREYVFKEDLTFCIHKAEYEVCAQVLSEHPQTVLCRAESQCDLLISLRSLANRPEYIIVVVETDPEYWTSVERFKIVQIKESGIGRTSFGIIPKQVGFLPYPSIYIHKCNAADHNDKESLNETELFGERLTSFHRNQGKQIHVLGQLIPSEDAVSSHSTGSVQKISLKTSAKQKIQKLFE